MTYIEMQVQNCTAEFIKQIRDNKLIDDENQINVSLKETIIKEAALEIGIIGLVVSFGVGVSSSLLATWIYNKFHSNAGELYIEGKRIKIEIASIEKRINIILENGNSDKI